MLTTLFLTKFPAMITNNKVTDIFCTIDAFCKKIKETIWRLHSRAEA